MQVGDHITTAWTIPNDGYIARIGVFAVKLEQKPSGALGIQWDGRRQLLQVYEENGRPTVRWLRLTPRLPPRPGSLETSRPPTRRRPIVYLVVAFGSTPHVVFRTQIKDEDSMIWPRVRGEDRRGIRPWPPQVKILATFKHLASLEDDEQDALLAFAQEFPPKPGRIAIGAGWLSPDGLWYPVEDGDHGPMGERISARFYRSLEGDELLRRRGWLRVQPNGTLTTEPGRLITPTEGQIDTLRDMSMLQGDGESTWQSNILRVLREEPDDEKWSDPYGRH
jgi:hypothetical protein